MKPTLQVRLSQHLALTPQLQQSIRLLQLSTLELHQEVEQMLDQNPFLETEDEGPGFEFTSVDRASSTSQREEADSAGASVGEGGDEPSGMDSADFGTTERDDWENGTERDDFDGIRETPGTGSGQGNDDDFEPQERSVSGPTLQEHLRQQLLGMRLSAQDAAAVHVLIESIDEDGYLDGTLEDIAERVADSLGLGDLDDRDELLDQLRCGLAWLQSMEPSGVGAANLGDCLCLQLRHRPAGPARDCAMAIARGHLELLARRDLKKLAAATHADEATVKAAQALIVACEPKPGRPFAPAESLIVVPDVIVVKSGRNWKVTLNPDVMPKLRVSELYAQAIRGQRGGGNLSARLQEARWFIRNIQQRFDTIQRVSQAIVERQKAFFTHGEIAMKPLVLREIADELGLHESTISRVTTAKYMATPFGTFELKYFFGSSLNTDAGGNASSTAVRALIKQFVAAEDTKKPLSDSQIADMLEEQGIQVARRTVAKYREALKIAPANLRKAM
ncbi:RNA polymerase factor sigma-54 [Ideonella sp. 4Y11]|uniref:RNA polymerase sigma-54 factor n=1 Tax=Ideonella aquatica TaxID=2824119 RepID=A0A941BKI6_9BURK|nr:RNA polymerase factor sigma-54 [Ideonella aquatica]MBQ0960552.1 RNA polymerase factor sigma-54 [Ideonella aquatica]